MKHVSTKDNERLFNQYLYSFIGTSLNCNKCKKWALYKGIDILDKFSTSGAPAKLINWEKETRSETC